MYVKGREKRLKTYYKWYKLKKDDVSTFVVPELFTPALSESHYYQTPNDLFCPRNAMPFPLSACCAPTRWCALSMWECVWRCFHFGEYTITKYYPLYLHCTLLFVPLFSVWCTTLKKLKWWWWARRVRGCVLGVTDWGMKVPLGYDSHVLDSKIALTVYRSFLWEYHLFIIWFVSIHVSLHCTDLYPRCFAVDVQCVGG